MIRAFMRQWFPRVLNIMFVLSVIGVLIPGFFIMSQPAYRYGGFLVGLGCIVGGLITVIMLYGALYVLLDIRDALVKRNQ